jgi:hypothetical protein
VDALPSALPHQHSLALVKPDNVKLLAEQMARQLSTLCESDHTPKP